METAMTVSEQVAIIPVEQVKNQIDQVKSLMANCMKDGVDYGRIPNCGEKPTLLQPGAQLINLMFGSCEDFDVTQSDLGSGHREYVVKCKLSSRATGEYLGSGMGSCSTMESKYRYRNVSDYEVTDKEIPQDARENKQEYRKQGFGMRKVDGEWKWVKFTDSQKSENPDIADTYNTVLKIACKRALIAATLNTFGVSSLFTQDIEDLPAYMIGSFSKPKASASQMDTYNRLSAQLSEIYDKDRYEIDDAIINSASLKESGAQAIDTLTPQQADIAIKQAETWVIKALKEREVEDDSQV